MSRCHRLRAAGAPILNAAARRAQPGGPGPRSRRPVRQLPVPGMSSLVMSFVVLLAAAGCSLTPLPGLTWVRLPDAPPAVAPAAVAASGWQLLPVALPAYLDREAVMVAEGSATLRALPDLRWAEPLRDAVPRVLRDELARQLGPPAPVPASVPVPVPVPVPVQLRVLVHVLDLAADQRSLRLRASWTVARPGAGAGAAVAAPIPGEATFDVPAGPGAEAIGQAHRQALARLAASIAATLRNP